MEEVVKKLFYCTEESIFNEHICHDNLMITISITSICTDNFAG